MTLGTPPNFDRFQDEVEHLEEILLDDDSWPEDGDEWGDDYWELDDSWPPDEL